MIARVGGPAYGGGVGLVASCEIAIAADIAIFALSEARPGLAPAVIAPYVIAAVGGRQARRLFLSGVRGNGNKDFKRPFRQEAQYCSAASRYLNSSQGCRLVNP